MPIRNWAASGRIRDPRIDLPEGGKSIGNILKSIGHAIDDDRPLARDADCGALSVRVLN